MPRTTYNVIIDKVLSIIRARITDGETNMALASSKNAVNGTGSVTLLNAAGAGKRNRLHSLVISSTSPSNTVTISDGFGTHAISGYAAIAISLPIGGAKQNTANTAITITHNGGGTIYALCAYSTE